MTLADGILLMRVAEDMAELGAAVVLDDETSHRVQEIARKPESLELVARRLDDEAIATVFLERIAERCERQAGLQDDDEARLVASTAALGSLLMHTASAPTAEAFEIGMVG